VEEREMELRCHERVFNGIKVATTISKSQGQPLKHVGVYHPTPTFSYGQLYMLKFQEWPK